MRIFRDFVRNPYDVGLVHCIMLWACCYLMISLIDGKILEFEFCSVSFTADYQYSIFITKCSTADSGYAMTLNILFLPSPLSIN